MNVCWTANKKDQPMTSRFVRALVALFLLTGAYGQAAVNIESYQDWKNARIEEAQSQLERLQGKQEKGISGKREARAASGANANSSKLDPKIRQAQENLDLARELTVNDYFLLYLRQFREREAFIEAAKKMTPEEVADLLMAYQKSVSGAHDALSLDVPVPAAAQLRSDSTASK